MATKGSPIWDEVIEDLNRITESLRKTGEVPPDVRVTRYRIRPVRPFAPGRVKKVRSAVAVSRDLFAALLGVTPQTVAAWETGTRKPNGMANRFLSEVESNPSHWRKRLTAMYEREVAR